MSTISILNDLITIAKDGEQGFFKVAEEVKDQKLKELFIEKAQERSSIIKELQELISNLGEEPTDSGSMLGALHRGWIDVKAAIIDRENSAIIAECINGEETAINTYAKALEESLPDNIINIIESQYEKIKQSYNTVKELKEEYEEESIED